MEGMMCLGLGWDSQTSKYSKPRQIDNVVAPNIPCELLAMVRRAMLDAQALMEKKHAAGNVEDILPMVSPDICIVQLYTAHGQLRFHQDRDMSGKSRFKNLSGICSLASKVKTPTAPLPASSMMPTVTKASEPSWTTKASAVEAKSCQNSSKQSMTLLQVSPSSPKSMLAPGGA